MADYIAYSRHVLPRYVSNATRVVTDDVHNFESFADFGTYVFELYPDMTLVDIVDVWVRHCVLFQVHPAFAFAMLKADIDEFFDSTVLLCLNPRFDQELRQFRQLYKSRQHLMNQIKTHLIPTQAVKLETSTSCYTWAWTQSMKRLFAWLNVDSNHVIAASFRGIVKWSGQHRAATLIHDDAWMRAADNTAIRLMLANGTRARLMSGRESTIHMTTTSTVDVPNILHPLPCTVSSVNTCWSVIYFTGIPCNPTLIGDLLLLHGHLHTLFWRRAATMERIDTRNNVQSLDHCTYLIDAVTGCHVTLHVHTYDGQKCTKAVVECRERCTAETIAQRVGVLLECYVQHAKSLLDTYQSVFGDAFQLLAGVAVCANTNPSQRARLLRRFAPDVFASQFSRMVHRDRMLTKYDNPDEVPESLDVLVFPKFGMSLTTQPSTYAATHPAFPYIGLTINNLANSDELPVLPCAFKKPQKNRGVMRMYHQAKTMAELKTLLEIDSASKIRKRPLKTSRFTAYNETGYLPSAIVQALSVTLNEKSWRRRGVLVSRGACDRERKSGLLVAAMTALGAHVPMSGRDAFVTSERHKLASTVFPELCAQECFDMDMPMVKTHLGDPDVELDATRHIRAVEVYLDTRIFVFTRTPDRTEGTFVHPRHAPCAPYISAAGTHSRAVALYRHTGGVYSQVECYEVISTEGGQTVFPADALDKLVSTLMLPVFQGKPFTAAVAEHPRAIAQQIDNYGKTVGLLYDDNTYVQLDKPWRPFNLPLVPSSRRSLTAEQQHIVWGRRLLSAWVHSRVNIHVDAVRYEEQQLAFDPNERVRDVYVPTQRCKDLLEVLLRRNLLNYGEAARMPADDAQLMGAHVFFGKTLCKTQ